jgi:CheY-like chemotaxis protein
MDTPKTAGTTLLIVEDNAIARVGLTTLLERSGYAVATATHGKEALDYLAAHPPPNVILLDMLLPVMDGWAFLGELAALPLSPRPRVIVTTGAAVIGREWVMAHGCHGFVRKPIEIDGLLAEIARCLAIS